MEEYETRKYNITAKKEQLDILEALFRTMEIMGNVGASRTIELYVDGDGAFHPTIKRNGKRLSNTVFEKEYEYGRISHEIKSKDAEHDPSYYLYYDFG